MHISVETSSLGMQYQAHKKLAEGPAKGRPVAPGDLPSTLWAIDPPTQMPGIYLQ